MLKFGRTYRLEIEGEDGEIVTIRNPFTLDFYVQRANLASLGTGTFIVKNLAEITRNKIYWDAYKGPVYPSVKLYAGYGTEQSLVFDGTIKESSSCREEGSVDFVTKVDGFMGTVGTQSAFLSQSMAGPVSQIQVIDAIIKNLSPLKVGYVSTGFKTVYPRGRSLCDYAWNLLQKETGSRCFVDNGRIYCMREGDVLPYEVFVITAASGLLGAPKRFKTFVTAEILFEPNLKVGQRVELRSMDNSYLNNIYTVTGIEHFGTISDSVGGKLKTRVSMFIGATPLFPALLSSGRAS